MIIHEIPSTASHILVSDTCMKTPSHTSKNFPAVNFNPRISLTCDVAITIAAADVNPTATGPDIKSIKKPRTN